MKALYSAREASNSAGKIDEEEEAEEEEAISETDDDDDEEEDDDDDCTRSNETMTTCFFFLRCDRLRNIISNCWICDISGHMQFRWERKRKGR